MSPLCFLRWGSDTFDDELSHGQHQCLSRFTGDGWGSHQNRETVERHTYIYIHIKYVLRLMDLVRDIHDSAITLYWEIKLLIVKTHQVTEQYTDYESPSKYNVIAWARHAPVRYLTFAISHQRGSRPQCGRFHGLSAPHLCSCQRRRTPGGKMWGGLGRWKWR